MSCELSVIYSIWLIHYNMQRWWDMCYPSKIYITRPRTPNGSGDWYPNIPIVTNSNRIVALQWRHNGCDVVYNHQPHHCFLNRLFRRRSKKTSKLRVTGLCAGTYTRGSFNIFLIDRMRFRIGRIRGIIATPIELPLNVLYDDFSTCSWSNVFHCTQFDIHWINYVRLQLLVHHIQLVTCIKNNFVQLKSSRYCQSKKSRKFNRFILPLCVNRWISYA